MKKHIASAILVLSFVGAAIATVTVNPPAIITLSAPLTSAQVQAFTSQVSGVPSGRTMIGFNIRVNPDGSGVLSVQAK